MLFRFSLYGFLKNQRYFEPFIILFFRDEGLSFTLIGTLVAVRELATNLMEIPSGALADLYGRRRAMITSFVAYIVSFVVFGLASNPAWLFLAMFFFGIGEAFRTGTHKAMIFDWLQLEGRADEKTMVYGTTRSWSQLGSAVQLYLNDHNGKFFPYAQNTPEGKVWYFGLETSPGSSEGDRELDRTAGPLAEYIDDGDGIDGG